MDPFKHHDLQFDAYVCSNVSHVEPDSVEADAERDFVSPAFQKGGHMQHAQLP